MSIASDLIRGNTDMIILAHLSRHDSYGYEINKMIQQASNRRLELKEATLYGAFRRLEEAGCIMFYWGDESTGARRRYYRITPSGRVALEQSLRDWGEAKDIIDTLIQKDNHTDGGENHDRENSSTC
ncbi:MAG: PadR family transcriptional regulator [Oscillospiraceae bacterium]|nr:PadR family transcriptional regulator [Oscillospiraceae bacterium]